MKSTKKMTEANQGYAVHRTPPRARKTIASMRQIRLTMARISAVILLATSPRKLMAPSLTIVPIVYDQRKAVSTTYRTLKTALTNPQKRTKLKF